MYKIEWDSETGGVLLSSRVTKETLGIAPRPVFHEELDLIGLDRLGWTYPHGKAPIMWAVNKQYFYRGRHLFDAKGANIYDAPTLVMADGVEPMALEPMDVKGMLAKNADQMFLIESEAIEFIRDTYVTYAGANRAHDAIRANKDADYEALAAKVEAKTKTKMAVVKEDCDSFDIVPLKTAKEEGKRVLLSTRIDRFIASFSGGKDSQVVLDLCTRAIPPTEFEVIYSDTGYELPPSLELYEQVKQYYQQRFPALKFSITRNHESVLNYWDKIGTPSDTHRWCCTVMKTAPLYRSLKVPGTNKQARVLAFEGVRAEESVRREGYNRIGKGVKHTFVINARPILDWNTSEIFLYLFRYELLINEAYRLGKPRVGCIFCPFSSPWDDMIVNKKYNQELTPFLSVIEDMVRKRKIPNQKEYISDRLWKLRSSGTNMENKTIVKLKNTETCFEATIDNPLNSLLDWLPTIGDLVLSSASTVTYGFIVFQTNKYKFTLEESKTKANFCVTDGNDTKLRYFLRRIIYKSAYCISCEACEIECPTGALSVYPHVQIDLKKCVRCMRCIDYHQHGCIVADSLVITMENINSNIKISRYGTFGIQEGWVDEFFADPKNFWSDNTLGVKQVPSFKAWLKDAELINEKNELTDLGRFCHENRDDFSTLIWEIIYINLCYNNPLLQWFTKDIPFETTIERKEMEIMIQNHFNGTFAKSSILYALQALLQVFKYSPIGTEFRQLEAIDAKGTAYKRNVYNDVSEEGVVYSIYKYARFKRKDMCREIDFYLVKGNEKFNCEVKLMGKGNPESADAIFSRGSALFVGDKLSEQNKRQADELGVCWVCLNDKEGYKRFKFALDKFNIPYVDYQGDFDKDLDIILNDIFK